MNAKILVVIILFLVGGLFLISQYSSNREVFGYFCTKISNANIQSDHFFLGDKSCDVQSRNIEPNNYGWNGLPVERSMYRVNLESNCGLVENEMRSQYSVPENARIFQNEDGTIYWCAGFNAGT